MTRSLDRNDARSLDPDEMVRLASDTLGGEPDEDPEVVAGLRRLTAALDAEARLTDDGLARTRTALVQALTNHHRVRHMMASRPLPPLPRPLVITGLLRTGTTFLHNLLSQHPKLRTPRLWELMHPADPRPESQLVRECERYVAEYYRAAPGFRAIHHLDARHGEECHRLTANTFRHFIYGLRYRVPGYLGWLAEQPMAPAYAHHRAALQCLLARPTADADAAEPYAVLLKCPSHLWHLDELTRSFPDATVVRLHRDPAVAIPSVCSLTATIRAARSRQVDPAEIGQEWLARVAAVLPGLRRGRGGNAWAPLDVRYADLVADPLGVAERVCDHAGVPMTDAARDAMTRFVIAGAGRPQERHRYRVESFGLRPTELADRFSGYLSEFELTPEFEEGRS
ncbi:sulfotransferase family protein [Salinispora fenicalii]|uniref:sulfotransferase family protein n=1 Tax=Salinispora fenicalii TaxID=1137263 RepID=UPI00048A2538|nr:sulfotransferase [Salinispora fenicalii]